MKFVTFSRSKAIHAADVALQPYCSQTNAAKDQTLQQVIAAEPTCKRCRALLIVLGITPPPDSQLRIGNEL